MENNSGHTARHTRSSDSSAMAVDTKSVAPEGGEANPMDRLTTMITPKKTGSTPSCFASGRSTGAKMMMAGTVSNHGSDHEQEEIGEQEKYPGVRRHPGEGVGQCERNALPGEDPSVRGEVADEEHHDARAEARPQQDLGQRRPAELSVHESAEEEAVENGNCRRLGRSEDAPRMPPTTMTGMRSVRSASRKATHASRADGNASPL